MNAVDEALAGRLIYAARLWMARLVACWDLWRAGNSAAAWVALGEAKELGDDLASQLAQWGVEGVISPPTLVEFVDGVVRETARRWPVMGNQSKQDCSR